MADPELLTFFEEFTTDTHGQIFLTGIIDIKDYRQADLEIIQFPSNVENLIVNVRMGKISGSTLAETVGTFPLGSLQSSTPSMSSGLRCRSCSSVVPLTRPWTFRPGCSCTDAYSAFGPLVATRASPHRSIPKTS